MEIRDIQLSKKYLILVCTFLILAPILDLWVTRDAVNSMPKDEFLERETGARAFKHQLVEGYFDLWFLTQFLMAMWLCGGLYYFNNINRRNYKFSSFMVVLVSISSLNWCLLPFLSWRVI